MRQTRFKWAAALALIMASPAVFWSCSSDDDDEKDPLTVNTNANKTGEHPEAGRLEIPKRREGIVDMFLVKRLSNGGINFCIEWDIAKKAQRWTAFRMVSSDLFVRDKTNNWRGGRSEAWAEDYEVQEVYRTNQNFFSGTGYTRGHMIASADRQSSYESNAQTFLYTNMQPQLYSFNGGIWATLEMKVRSWVKNTSDTLYVCRGGTIDKSKDILETTRTGLIVPKYFFMAILCKNKSTVNSGYKAIGFWMEHRSFYDDEKNVAPYIVSIDQLEGLTGIDFFCNLPDHIENEVEKAVVRNAWGFQ